MFLAFHPCIVVQGVFLVIRFIHWRFFTMFCRRTGIMGRGVQKLQIPWASKGETPLG